MKDKHSDPDYQRAVGAFVAREVCYCVSGLVCEIAKDREDYFHMFRVFDGDQAREFVAQELADDPEQKGEIEDFDLDDAGELKDAMDALCLDPADAECDVYEHWIVTDWLADKLKAKGEMIERDFYGLTIWGRTTTGQAILLDSVICHIYDEHHDNQPKRDS